MDINSAIIELYEMQSLEQMLTYLAQSKTFTPTIVPLQPTTQPEQSPQPQMMNPQQPPQS